MPIAFSGVPDGRRIAYYQFDQSGVPEFALINYTDTLYPVITKYKYPMPGQTNSAVRLGVVSAGGGATRWFQTPGDPRNTYIPYMEWTGDNQVILQHMNRLQNTNTVFLANPDTGELRQMFQDKNDTWVEVNRNQRWIEGGKRLLFTSERDGWRHLYAISREGDARLITNAPFDMVSLAAVDEPGGWVVLHRLAGERHPALPLPLPPGWKPDRARHARRPTGHPHLQHLARLPLGLSLVSTFDSPGESDLVSLPDHKVVRVTRTTTRRSRRKWRRSLPAVPKWCTSPWPRHDHRWLADPAPQVRPVEEISRSLSMSMASPPGQP